MDPTYSLREANSMIKRCNTPEGIDNLKSFLLKEICLYPLPDQGFLMAMMGLQIINMTDSIIYNSESVESAMDLLVSRTE
jgi:hypothetical protein